MAMFFVVMSLLTISVNGLSFDCNHIDMGWNVIHPIGQCVIGRNSASNGMMSMQHNCIDEWTAQSSVYDTNDCSGNDFEIVATHDCRSNTTSFIKCNCSFNKNEQCSLVTDIQYVKQKNGECDKSQFTDKRTYIVDSNEVPKSFIDSNCFERQSDQNGKDFVSKAVPFWFHKLSTIHF
eukprot:UN07394